MVQPARLFRANREKYLTRNDSYYYRSYSEIFRRHFLRRKDPVPHPLWTEETARRREEARVKIPAE